ncbi:hypothetical protein K1719_001231 [Acacia pycnantha]|nr:hypothetical protein K1719_001231 [Acacia pycnantha]
MGYTIDVASDNGGRDECRWQQRDMVRAPQESHKIDNGIHALCTKPTRPIQELPQGLVVLIEAGHSNLEISWYPWSWRHVVVTFPSLSFPEPGAVTYAAHDGYWKHGAQSSQIPHNNTIQPNYQTPLDLKSSYDKFQDQQKTVSSQGTDLQFPSPQQVPLTHIQVAPSMDTRRVSKLQIPTNPRIAPNLTLGLPKVEKDSSLNSAAPKPAYISVSLPKQPDHVLSNDAVNSILKIITKATADGTLHTKNWEIEPLFPIPDVDAVNKELSVIAKEDEAVKHALAVRAAVTSGNYVAFFRLYKAAPNLNTCLMDPCVEKMRYKAVNCMCRSYRPTVPVSYVAQILGFSTSLATNGESDEKDTDAFDECVEWLKLHGAIIISDNNVEMVLDTKASSSSLYMPEPEDAVAHGDANLAVNDFLARAPL